MEDQIRDIDESYRQAVDLLSKRVFKIETDVKHINKALDNPKDIEGPINFAIRGLENRMMDELVSMKE